MSKRARACCLAALLCLLFVAADEGSLRKWTDDSDAFSVEAAFLDSDGKTVRLEKTTGDVISVPIGRLSKADQELVRQLTAPQPNPFAAATGKIIEGRVVSVSDGDTLTVLDAQKVQHKIRLEGIDAPEGGQDYGQKAKEALSSKVFGKDVTVRCKEKDRYGRTVGSVHLGDRWIDRELVAEGWAWRYDDYSDSELLKQAQDEAKAAKLGLWADANEPVPPWIFRSPDKMQEWNEARLGKRGPPAVASSAFGMPQTLRSPSREAKNPP